MSRTSRTYLVGVGCLLWALVFTCFTDTSHSNGLPQAPVVTFSASEHAFHGPDTIRAGLIAVRPHNRGREPHQLQLIRLAEGKTLEDLSAILQAPNGSMPAWAVHMGGPNGVEAGEVAEALLYLEAGSYAVICLVPARDSRPHSALGMQKELRVIGSAASAPTFIGDIHVAMYDFEFVAVEPIEKGQHWFYVVNRGQSTHQVSLVRLEEGHSTEDVLAAFGDQTPPSMPGRLMGGISGLEPGGRGMFSAGLNPGRYALMCQFPNPSSPDSHAAQGMV